MNPSYLHKVSEDTFVTIATDSAKSFVKLVTDDELLVNPFFVSASTNNLQFTSD